MIPMGDEKPFCCFLGFLVRIKKMYSSTADIFRIILSSISYLSQKYIDLLTFSLSFTCWLCIKDFKLAVYYYGSHISYEGQPSIWLNNKNSYCFMLQRQLTYLYFIGPTLCRYVIPTQLDPSGFGTITCTMTWERCFRLNRVCLGPEDTFAIFIYRPILVPQCLW